MTLLTTTFLGAGPALAERVLSETSHWNADRTRIYTDRVVERDDGSVDTVRVAGGSVDGIAMIQIAEAYRPPLILGFVRTGSKTSGKPLYWDRSCVFITPNSKGSRQIAGTAEFDAIRQSTLNWNDATASCSYMKLMYESPEAGLDVAYDGKNTVVFREDKWCTPAHGGMPEDCHDPNITALTTVFHVDTVGAANEGQILDADMEINSVDFSMAVGCETTCMTLGTSTDVEDLENTVTHELGHVMGLAHTCWPGDPAQAPLDNTGQKVPQCFPLAALPQAVRDTTMFPFEDPREIKKRSPEADDINGICTVYPKAKDPNLCAPVDPPGGGCAVPGSGGGPGAWLALLGLAALRRRRR
ncbi:MAG TPA: MYXO-CTERM sorting domain-containing protein [Haliangiales bacterium]|nr:MYXO-CTERM sorting domain-containing protein [Haliangiales bacterium]